MMRKVMVVPGLMGRVADAWVKAGRNKFRRTVTTITGILALLVGLLGMAGCGGSPAGVDVGGSAPSPLVPDASQPVTATETQRPTDTAVPPTVTETLAPSETAAPQASATRRPSLPLERSAQDFQFRVTFQAGLGDLDGDGDLDVVFANPQKNASAVWLNTGEGIFEDTGQALTQYGHGVGLADLDGDGDLDAVVVCHEFSEPSKVYWNDGMGNLSDSGQDWGDGGMSAVDVNLVDINADGHLDVHVVYFDFSGLPDQVYLNDGSGNFMDSGLRLVEDTLAWGDLDGDGDLDYFGKSWAVGYRVGLNDGSGRFAEGWQLAEEQTTVGGIVLADFDQDGDLDALVANGYRETGSYPSRLLWNDGSGQFSDSGVPLKKTLGSELAVGDLDGDGDLDVYVSNMDRPNEVWLNDGGGVFVDSGLRLGQNTDMSGRATLGDVDGDGDLDVVVGRFQGGAEVWFNLGVQE